MQSNGKRDRSSVLVNSCTEKRWNCRRRLKPT